jgi:surface protein
MSIDAAEESIALPTDVLLQVLQCLSAICDITAQRAWHQLAFLTFKRDGLAQRARNMPRPILLRIQITNDSASVFKIPFMQAKEVCVDVDWGDGCVDALCEKGAGYVEHTYASEGEYAVRIFPAERTAHSSAKRIWLDHLGFDESFLDEMKPTVSWWQPLRGIVSLGTCGVRSLSYLFTQCKMFAFDLRHLRTGNIDDMSGLFRGSSFNQPIGGWDVGNVTNLSHTFSTTREFNQPIGAWNVSNVTDMSYTFDGATSFDQPIGSWDVSKVANMTMMFRGAVSFNQSLGDWNVSNVTDMSFMFCEAFVFNQQIGRWDVGNVTDMSGMMFRAHQFNQPIAGWNVSKVTQMSFMFYYATSFDQPIGDWDVGSVTSMASMFARAIVFNQPIGDWNVGSVRSMQRMFSEASAFNQPLVSWNVSNVTDMRFMFGHALAFNQPLEDWKVNPHAKLDGIFCVAKAFTHAEAWNLHHPLPSLLRSQQET